MQMSRRGGRVIICGLPLLWHGMATSSSAAPIHITKRFSVTSPSRASMKSGLIHTGSWPPPDWVTYKASIEEFAPTVTYGNNTLTYGSTGKNRLARPLRPQSLPPWLFLALLSKQSLLVCQRGSVGAGVQQLDSAGTMAARTGKVGR